MDTTGLQIVLGDHFYDDEKKRIIELYNAGIRPFRVSVDMYRVSVAAGNEIVINRKSIQQQLLESILG